MIYQCLCAVVLMAALVLGFNICSSLIVHIMTNVLDTRGDLLVNNRGQVLHTLNAREVHEGLDALTQFPPWMHVDHPIYLRAELKSETDTTISDSGTEPPTETIAIALMVSTVSDIDITRVFQGNADSSIICIRQPGESTSQLLVKVGEEVHEVDLNGKMQIVAITSLRKTKTESIGAWDSRQSVDQSEGTPFDRAD